MSEGKRPQAARSEASRPARSEAKPSEDRTGPPSEDQRVRRRVRVIVHGRVQGVAFRAHTAEQARRAGVSGWVRNRPDGSVEAAFEGADNAVEALLAFVRRGPRAARVDAVDAIEEPLEGNVRFEVRG
jgi:acylphosphatase